MLQQHDVNFLCWCTRKKHIFCCCCCSSEMHTKIFIIAKKYDEHFCEIKAHFYCTISAAHLKLFSFSYSIAVMAFTVKWWIGKTGIREREEEEEKNIIFFYHFPNENWSKKKATAQRKKVCTAVSVRRMKVNRKMEH